MAMKERWYKLKSTRWFTILTNKFVMATLGFVVWMLFLDINSYLIHHELNTEIEELEESIQYYRTEIESDEKKLEELTTDDKKLEKFAREQYWMHREGEQIFLIEQGDHG
jgi:cell division protein DivIC